jgi:hypothetical protein
MAAEGAEAAGFNVASALGSMQNLEVTPVNVAIAVTSMVILSLLVRRC